MRKNWTVNYLLNEQTLNHQTRHTAAQGRVRLVARKLCKSFHGVTDRSVSCWSRNRQIDTKQRITEKLLYHAQQMPYEGNDEQENWDHDEYEDVNYNDIDDTEDTFHSEKWIIGGEERERRPEISAVSPL